MALHAVAFDLWETLITDSEELSDQQQKHRLRALSDVLHAHGLSHTDEEVTRAHRDLWKECHLRYWSNDRDIPTRVQVEHFVEALGVEALPAHERLMQELEEAYSDAPLRILPAVVPHALDTVAALAERGLEIGLVSNTGRTPGTVLRKVLDALGFGRFLQAMVFSNEVGVCKPQHSIFRELSQQLSASPQETLFVGDNIYCDVWGAQRAGMRAIHFVPRQRGTAVGPDVEHGLTIEPDGVVESLDQLPREVDRLAGIPFP